MSARLNHNMTFHRDQGKHLITEFAELANWKAIRRTYRRSCFQTVMKIFLVAITKLKTSESPLLMFT